jgi:hypothetical protein
VIAELPTASLMQHLWLFAAGVLQLINNTPKATDPRVQQLLGPDELALYTSTTKPAKLCGSMLSALISSAGFHIEQEVHVNAMLSQVAANVSQVARIKLQAMPFGERHAHAVSTACRDSFLCMDKEPAVLPGGGAAVGSQLTCTTISFCYATSVIY